MRRAQTIKLYLAAKFARRKEIREQADKLWNAGFEIISTWIQETTKPKWMTHEQFMKKLAFKDAVEIGSADVIIVDTAFASETGGKEVELGFGLAHYHHKLVFLVGPKRNVFHEFADEVFADWDACLQFMIKNYGEHKVEVTNG